MKANSLKKSSPVRTRRAIINLLKQEGPADALTLAERLSVSGMAIRQHLYVLQKEHLVTYTEEPRLQGRPAKLWQLTSEADRFFPDGYAELTVSLLESMSEAFGNEAIAKLLEVRTRKQKKSYRQEIPKNHSLQKRLETLAQLRIDEGYMAEVERRKDGSWLLIENHCPICAAAKACTGLCDRELELFQSILGEEVKVERTEHIIEGDRRCVYQIWLK
ncbi:transcriptional regulator [Pleurocapsales cyanobacterium LEGE 06147]|nr:transcriptional regulator [Pleurocapsales cyanobacterium LEGE 06147]